MKCVSGLIMVLAISVFTIYKSFAEKRDLKEIAEINWYPPIELTAHNCPSDES